MSPLWILLGLRRTEVVSGDNWSYKTCKPNRRENVPTPNFLLARCFSYRATNSVGSVKEKVSQSMYNCLSQAYLGSYNFVFDH